MKVITSNNPNELGNLVYAEMPKPVIKDDEVLIKVKAISINPVDAKTRIGKGIFSSIKTEGPLILGWDISGTVTETGKDVTLFKKDDAVFGMVNFPGHGKAYAEYVAAPASHITLKPENITHEEAAASTLAALTAWQALITNARIKANDKVLIHGASGGVGHFAVQLAKHLGAYVTGTSSAKNKAFVELLGADEHIDYVGYDWKNRTDEFDFVLDTIGGDNMDLSIDITKSGGTVISIPTGLNEAVVEKAKKKGVNGYFILVESNGDDMKQIANLLKNKTLKPHISTVYQFDEMEKAHKQIESGRTKGKVIVTL